MKKNMKRGMLVLILLLAVGFATVTATLYINGVITLGEDKSDFENNLIFSKASLSYSDEKKTDIADVTGEGTDSDSLRIVDGGKKISFATETLSAIDETVTLTYDITNNSQFDAEFTGITCVVKDSDGTDITTNVTSGSEYIQINAKDFKNGEVNVQLAKNTTLEGHTLEIKQIKSYVGDKAKNYSIECTINASGLNSGN